MYQYYTTRALGLNTAESGTGWMGDDKMVADVTMDVDDEWPLTKDDARAPRRGRFAPAIAGDASAGESAATAAEVEETKPAAADDTPLPAPLSQSDAVLATAGTPSGRAERGPP